MSNERFKYTLCLHPLQMYLKTMPRQDRKLALSESISSYQDFPSRSPIRDDQFTASRSPRTVTAAPESNSRGKTHDILCVPWVKDLKLGVFLWRFVVAPCVNFFWEVVAHCFDQYGSTNASDLAPQQSRALPSRPSLTKSPPLKVAPHKVAPSWSRP